VDAAALRSEFPVLAERAYLTAGTCGPLPSAAVRAASERLGTAAREGRAGAYFIASQETRARQRKAYATLLGSRPADVALTTCTSEGIVRVLAGMELGSGDEVLTAPDEHPGLLGPLATLAARRGVEVRIAPFAELADAVGPRTRLVACSHVSWHTGALRPAGLARLGAEVPVLLDGAQGIGAVPVDVEALACAFYAGSGQKWLCGPVGTGMLWVSPAWRERLAPVGATFVNLADPAGGLGSPPQPDARAHDAPALAPETSPAPGAAPHRRAAAGWDAVHERARTLAATLERRLRETGRMVAARAATTLVAWEQANATLVRDRLGAEGIVVRDLPGTSLLRASVGAWNDEEDLERLLAAL
jgi:selenocysteine lyase/cysteine desulfurase